jgi:predicted PurR-regulated permease PerM
MTKNQRMSVLGVLGVVCVLVVGFVYQNLIMPVGLAAFFAFLLSPLVNMLSLHRLPRWALALAIIGTWSMLMTVAVIELVPKLFNEILYLLQMAPGVWKYLETEWLPVVREVILKLGVQTEFIDRFMLEISDVFRWSEQMQSAIETLWYSTPQVIGTVVNIVLIPLLTFFFVKEERRILHTLRNLVPHDFQQPLQRYVKELVETMNGVVKGQILVAMTLAGMYAFGLWMTGIYAGVTIGLIAGACRIIPYLDVIVGLMLSCISLLSNWQGASQLFFVLGVFVSVQALDAAIVTPRVIGMRLGVHPMIVILTILAFADRWQFWGVLLAVPTVAVVKVSGKYALAAYKTSRLYHDSPRHLTQLKQSSISHSDSSGPLPPNR